MIKVYSIDKCKYCTKVKVALECAKLDFSYIVIPEDEKSNFMDRLGFVDTERTFPKVYKSDGTLIGGWEETFLALARDEI